MARTVQRTKVRMVGWRAEAGVLEGPAVARRNASLPERQMAGGQKEPMKKKLPEMYEMMEHVATAVQAKSAFLECIMWGSYNPNLNAVDDFDSEQVIQILRTLAGSSEGLEYNQNVPTMTSMAFATPTEVAHMQRTTASK